MAALSSYNMSLFSSSSALLLLLLLTSVVSSQYSTSFSIYTFTPNSQMLAYERDAVVPPHESYVRLTPGSLTVGRVLYKFPVTLWEEGMQLKFKTTVTLQITSFSERVGEGMTFFIIPINSTTSTGGLSDNLGIYDAVVPGSPVFAVEIDVASGAGHGQLDPSYKHIGINIDTQKSQNTTRVENDIIGTRVTLGITYDVPTRRIDVVATYGSTTATVSSVLNLAGFLPKQVQLGLSASASTTYASYFDVYTWDFYSAMVSDLNSLTTRKKNNDTYIKQYVRV